MKQSFITIFCILSVFTSLTGHDQRDDSAAKGIETWVNPAFFKFIRDGNFFSVKQLLEATPAFNVNDYERENSVRAWPLPNAHTAIETATQSGHADITRLLADRGANLIDALNTHNPAIHEKILDTLIKAGVNLNYQSPDTGWTPLIAATARGYPYLVERLLSLPSVDQAIKDNMGNTYKDYAKIEQSQAAETQQEKREIQDIIYAHEALQHAQTPNTRVSTDRRTVPDVEHIQALFSARDNIQEKLISLIEAETVCISLAIYTFTLQPIAEALKQASIRGVKIQIVSDAAQTRMLPAQSQVFLKLLSCGAGIYTWPKVSKENATMHNKFIIFDSTTSEGCPVLWTGSCNLTYWAAGLHEENVLIIKNHSIIETYRKEFERLQKASFLFRPQ